MKSEYKSAILIILAGCMWGCMGLLVRPLNALGLYAMDIVAVRAWVTMIATIATYPMLCKQEPKADIKYKTFIKDIWVFIGTGIASIVFFNYCYFSAIILTDLSIAAIMLYTAPIFVMIISAVVFKDIITKKKILALLFALLGCVIVTGVIGGDVRVNPGGILVGIGSAFGYALYSIFGKIATQKGYSSAMVTLMTFIFASIGVLPFADYGKIFRTFSGNYKLIAYSIVMILIVTYFPYILYTMGLSGIEPSKAAIIATIEPVAATAVGMIAFGEKPSAMTVCGIVLVIIAIVLTNEKMQHE